MDARTANRLLYERLGADYEAVDGRRTPLRLAWLRRRLQQVLADWCARGGAGDRVPRVLDLGAGNGWVGRAWANGGVHRWGIDLSVAMIASARGHYDAVAAADAAALPFADASFDLVTAFATLHHLDDFGPLAAEIARVLRPNGVFFSDHDLDGRFARRYRNWLRCYRRLQAWWRPPPADGDLVACAEHHAAGLPVAELVRALTRAGLQVQAGSHGYGLAAWADWWFGEREWPDGKAPLLVVRAVRPPIGATLEDGGIAVAPQDGSGREQHCRPSRDATSPARPPAGALRARPAVGDGR